jgi:hypothetical protein
MVLSSGHGKAKDKGQGTKDKGQRQRQSEADKGQDKTRKKDGCFAQPNPKGFIYL